jgi:hypothetical protein
MALARPAETMTHSTRLISACAILIAALALPAQAQTSAPAPPPDPQPSATPMRPAEIELNTINLPTTQSIGKHKSYFRLTHRFARDLRRGELSSLAEDLFSLDNGAIIGLEYRFGILSNLQAGIHRSLFNKTIETFARWDAIRQGDHLPIAVSVTGSYEGLDNLHNRRQPGISATVSHTYRDRLALYATPAYIWRTHEADLIAGHDEHLPGGEHEGHHDTSYVGLGARVRFSPTGYLVGEFTPRLSGYDPNSNSWGIAVEKLTAGHTLQLNFTNTFGTTPGQLARGGNQGQVYLGFNITRRF